ncbi:hypothetical protein [Clostridium akagii]|uniref:hypothetical protein n=1 Tax=Clostridium akagii TaxID=91623 RepID=UPI00047BC88D|nr:hypothetical protein [Clostridium akagii]
MDDNGLNGRLKFVFALQLVNAFDKLPFKNVRCHINCGGQNLVTRVSLYAGNYNGKYWVYDKCDPYNDGACSGKLAYVSKFSQVIGFIIKKHMKYKNKAKEDYLAEDKDLYLSYTKCYPIFR